MQNFFREQASKLETRKLWLAFLRRRGAALRSTKKLLYNRDNLNFPPRANIVVSNRRSEGGHGPEDRTKIAASATATLGRVTNSQKPWLAEFRSNQNTCDPQN